MNVKQAETGKSIFRNVLYGFSTWLLPIFLSFAAIPIIINALGDKDYGIYTLVLGFVGYSFNFSLGRAVTKYIAEYRITNQNEKIKDIISTTFIMNVVVGLFNLIFICSIAGWLVRDVFNIELQDQTKTINAFYIAAAIIFFLMLNQVFNAVLQGIQRFDVFSKVFNFGSIILILGNLIIALFGYGLIELLLWNLFVTIINNVLFFISAKRLLPEFGINFRFKKETLFLVLRFSSGVIGYQIVSNFLLLFERGWMTRHLGAESLTYYIVPMTLAIYIQGFIASLLLVIFPLASELKNNRPKLLNLYTKATKIVCLVVVFMATSLIVQGNVFLTVWLGSEFAEKSYLILILHTITFGIVAIQIVSWQMTEGLGYPSYNFFLITITLVIFTILMLFLINDYEGVGVAIARLCGFASIFFSVFYVEKWFFNNVQISLWLKIIGILSISALISSLTEKLIIANLSTSWITLIISTICGGIVYLFISWILGFITEDEKLLMKKILSKS